jgi:hypothetical protein
MGSDRITVNKYLGRGTQKVRGVGGRYNVTLCSYCLMVQRVAMIRVHGEFIRDGLGVGARNWRIGVQQYCDVG